MNNLKFLYFDIAIISFLLAVSVYCLGKFIKHLKELKEIFKEYKKSHSHLTETLKELNNGK